MLQVQRRSNKLVCLHDTTEFCDAMLNKLVLGRDEKIFPQNKIESFNLSFQFKNFSWFLFNSVCVLNREN